MLSLFVILTIAYNTRLLVINNLILSNTEKKQPNIDQLEVTCLDLNITNNMSIVINQLCIKSTKVDIKINDMKIQWQYAPKTKITDVDIRLVDIKGKAHLFSNINTTSSNSQHNKYNQNLRQILSTTLKPYIKQITQLKLPKNININEIFYTPFTGNNVVSKEINKSYQQAVMPYSAELLTKDNIYSFSLQNNKKIEFFKAKFTPEKHSFIIELSSKLNLLKNFTDIHRLPITTLLQNNLRTNEINGNVELLIKHQAGAFSLQSHINELSINSPNGLGQSGAFTLSGSLNFNSHFMLVSEGNAKSKVADKNNTEIALNFIGENEVLLEYSQPHIISLLEDNHLSSEIITLVKDNPSQHIKLIVKGDGILSLNDQKGFLSHIEISAYNNQLIHQVKLDNITLSSATIVEKKPAESSSKKAIDNTKLIQEAQTFYPLEIEHFTIDSQLNLTSITKLTKAPFVFHL
jgi:hypothetical protein